MGPLAGDKELGVLALGVQGVGGDDAPGQAQRLEQRRGPGDLVGLAVHPDLAEHNTTALIEDDDKAGTVFRSDHWIRHPHDLGTVPAPHPGERTRHPVINKPSRHYAGTLGGGGRSRLPAGQYPGIRAAAEISARSERVLDCRGSLGSRVDRGCGCRGAGTGDGRAPADERRDDQGTGNGLADGLHILPPVSADRDD